MKHEDKYNAIKAMLNLMETGIHIAQKDLEANKDNPGAFTPEELDTLFGMLTYAQMKPIREAGQALNLNPDRILEVVAHLEGVAVRREGPRVRIENLPNFRPAGGIQES